uniref:WD40 repeat domain 95 n=1 Tax=Anabas testudineus TaxID=64144 RepID=A0A3Q1IFA4_ANATE
MLLSEFRQNIFKHSLLVTGGMDRFIRMWNPHFSGKPTGILKGLSAPVVYLCISSEDSQIFCVSIDNTVKVIHDSFLCLTCVLTNSDAKASRIHGEISACSYFPAMKSLFFAADCLAVLSLKMRLVFRSRLTVSHNEPVMCCGYSEEFRQVVSCTERSVVKVWDLDTGRQVFEFGGTNDLSAITCMTFDLKGRRLITGGKDGCLKIWNFNNGQCLKTLRKDGDCQELCDLMICTVKCLLLFCQDVPEDLCRIQKPQTTWQDDLKNGHKEDILCVVHCPPCLLATGSYDGEIIVWNVVSGCIQGRFLSPPPAEYQHVQGDIGASVNPEYTIYLHVSVLHTSCVFFFFRSGHKFICNFFIPILQSRFQQKITKLAKSEKDTFLYAADQIGYIHVYNMETVLPEKPSPISSHVSLFWSSLQIVDSDQVVLTSSTDYTVRLWSAHGEFIGTFGQTESWSVHISSSWMHPAVPYEVLIDPLSMPDHEILNVKKHLSDAINPDRTEADRGELEVSCNTLQMIIWAV